jgi:hypothetical protein
MRDRQRLRFVPSSTSRTIASAHGPRLNRGMAPHFLTILTGRNLPKNLGMELRLLSGQSSRLVPTFLPHIRELTRV